MFAPAVFNLFKSLAYRRNARFSVSAARPFGENSVEIVECLGFFNLF
jgi:hypothetical protein